MNAIDNALARLQTIALACTTVSVKLAPAFPVSDASMLPLSIAHLVEGSGQADDAASVRLLVTANVDVHFSRQNMKEAYQKSDAFAVEYLRRLSGDPTLGGTIDTIIFPVTFGVSPADWGSVQTHMLSFTVQFKELTTPI